MDELIVRSLYPSTLFHFTNKKSFFKILLQCSFNLSYAKEKITYEKDGKTLSREWAIPMVSFCDLRLSELENHINNYGAYGVGLTKDWANKNDLNPVFYVNKSSDYTKKFIEGLNSVYLNVIPNKNLSNFEKNALNTYRYMKNYEDLLERRGRPKIKNYRFADEREWRFVPNISDNSIEHLVSKSKFDQMGKAYFNKQIEFYQLQFNFNDIKYLILNDENEIEALIEHLKHSWEPNDTAKLVSRIFTAKQIKDDV